MIDLDEVKKKLASYKSFLADRYKVGEIGIFGSYLRGEQTAASDLDLLVSFREPVSLLEFVHLENHLSVMLGVKVDLVMKSALKPRIGKHILEEVVSRMKREFLVEDVIDAMQKPLLCRRDDVGFLR